MDLIDQFFTLVKLEARDKNIEMVKINICVKRNNISYNMSLPVWRAIFLPCSKKPYSAGFAAMQ